MIRISRGAAALWPLLTAVTVAAGTPAFSQAPTEAQRAAIKSECRADYMAHCSSIPPGGEASLQCLQKNIVTVVEKYGFCRQRYYQLLEAFQQGGVLALQAKKTGPKSNYRRTEQVVRQVLRYLFLDTDASAEVVVRAHGDGLVLRRHEHRQEEELEEASSGGAGCHRRLLALSGPARLGVSSSVASR